MARYRLSGPAQIDISHILARSAALWGPQGRRRYGKLLADAFRKVANEPECMPSQNRSQLWRGLRSIHLRHIKAEAPDDKVQRPVHLVFYRPLAPELIEIVRILHERMDPALHLSPQNDE